MKDKVPKVGMLVQVLGVFTAGAVPYSYGQAVQGVKLLYYAEDMLAALLLFFVVFSLVAVMILVLILLDEGLYRVLASVGLFIVNTALRRHRTCLHIRLLGRISPRFRAYDNALTTVEAAPPLPRIR
jgi:hypothetical protein